jgi:hypothetical protein
VPQQDAEHLPSGGAGAGDRCGAHPHQIAHGLMPRIGHPDRGQLPGTMQACEHDRIPPGGLDPLSGLARNLRRGGNHALVPKLGQAAMNTVPARTGLVADVQLPAVFRQLRRQPVKRGRVVRDLTKEPNLTAAALFSHRDRDRRLVDIQPHEADTLRHGPPPAPEALCRPIRHNPRSSHCEAGHRLRRTFGLFTGTGGGFLAPCGIHPPAKHLVQPHSHASCTQRRHGYFRFVKTPLASRPPAARD